MRELLTVQLGPLSNHLGSYYWHFQELNLPSHSQSVDLDPSVLFHSNAPSSRLPLYTPRLQLFDFSSNLITLPQPSAAPRPRAPPRTDALSWDGPAQVYKREALPPPVELWSARWRTPLHPRSVTSLPKNGITARWEEVYEEGLRWFAEGCDAVGGLQFIGDVFSENLAGMSADYLMHLRDELGQGMAVVFVEPVPLAHVQEYVMGGSRKRLKLTERWTLLQNAAEWVGGMSGSVSMGVERLNAAFALSDILEANAQYVPVLGLQGKEKMWESAMIALALDGLSAPARKLHGGLRMDDVVNKMRRRPCDVVSGLKVGVGRNSGENLWPVSPGLEGRGSVELVSVRGKSAISEERQGDEERGEYWYRISGSPIVPVAWLPKGLKVTPFVARDERLKTRVPQPGAHSLKSNKNDLKVLGYRKSPYSNRGTANVEVVAMAHSANGIEGAQVLRRASASLRKAGSEYESKAELLEALALEYPTDAVETKDQGG